MQIHEQARQALPRLHIAATGRDLAYRLQLTPARSSYTSRFFSIGSFAYVGASSQLPRLSHFKLLLKHEQAFGPDRHRLVAHRSTGLAYRL